MFSTKRISRRTGIGAGIMVAVVVIVIVVAAIAYFLTIGAPRTNTTSSTPLSTSTTNTTSSTPLSTSTTNTTSSLITSSITSNSTSHSNSTSSGSNSTASGAITMVSMPSGVGANQSLNFKPANITVVVGVNNTILWTNNDNVPHTVTSTSVPSGAKSFDSGILSPGKTFQITLTAPGTYRYYCTLHPTWMKGTITVLAK